MVLVLVRLLDPYATFLFRNRKYVWICLYVYISQQITKNKIKSPIAGEAVFKFQRGR